MNSIHCCLAHIVLQKKAYTEYFTFLSTDDSSDNLISPCDCTGTLGLVHKSCLEKWLSASNKTECEICKYRFNTSRHPRSVWQWFRSHQGLNCHQGLYGDVLCLLILTPPCLVSIYLCGMGSAMYMRHGLWEAMGLAMLCCFLFATFLLWVVITVRLVIPYRTPWQLYQTFCCKTSILIYNKVQKDFSINERTNKNNVNGRTEFPQCGLRRYQTDPGIYYIKNQQDATLAVLFISNCKITLHVSALYASIIRSTKNCPRSVAYCSGNQPWTSLLDIYHPNPWHAPVPATTVLVLLMMDAESVRNM